MIGWQGDPVLLDLAPLRTSRPFRRWWTGRTFSGFGSQMTLVAVLYQVWESTHSTVWTGAAALAQAVPILAFGLFAGTLVDRVDRRKYYLCTLTGQLVCSVVLAVQGFAGQLPVPVLLAVVVVQSTFVAGGGPAARTFAPSLLPRTQVGAGLALNRISFQGAMLLGPALAGVVLGWAGVGGCYAVDAGTFLLAFYGVFGLPPMRPDGEPSRPGLRGVADGLAFLVREPAVRGALLTDLAAMVLSMPTSLFPLINEERFGGNPHTLGLFMSAIALGGVLASVFSGTFTRLRPGPVMLAGSAGWGVALVVFGLVPNAWLGLGCLVLAGAADTVSVVSRGTVVQLNTPNSMLGRVGAAEQIVGLAGPDVGNLRAGLVADATSGAVALVTGGVLCVLAVALVAWRTPALRE
ncbi:Predicted arabinose efflux permease, MFS family [Amycolatopsis sacchari]|uniref:Predicted arabinose efflux permease, MFS family n=1 Tax=Amycolatopsis sacchari TaxID=115433 RepID=A0A1I3UCW3_9PSEU|nr:MFS transporter [Amycolatopsis sacchari]SFJ81344.1 Predicted arabinose efflux permease, MFS family [Amycolatopsis sacchari]